MPHVGNLMPELGGTVETKITKRKLGRKLRVDVMNGQGRYLSTKENCPIPVKISGSEAVAFNLGGGGGGVTYNKGQKIVLSVGVCVGEKQK